MAIELAQNVRRAAFGGVVLSLTAFIAAEGASLVRTGPSASASPGIQLPQITKNLDSSSLPVPACDPTAHQPASLPSLDAHGGNPLGTRVAVVGDSITALAEPQIAATLAGEYSLQISGRSGATIDQQLPTIEGIQHSSDRRPDDWIIELGTNDGGACQNRNWQADFRNEVAAVRSARCVIFVTLSSHLTRAGLVGPSLNRAIFQSVAHHLNFHVLDWGNIEYKDPEWTSPRDGIHPTPKGSTELASLEAQALHAFG